MREPTGKMEPTKQTSSEELAEQMPAALDTIKAVMHAHFGIAWAWHCGIVRCFMDENASRAAANRAAARVMKICFDYDITAHKQYKSTQTDV